MTRAELREELRELKEAIVEKIEMCAHYHDRDICSLADRVRSIEDRERKTLIRMGKLLGLVTAALGIGGAGGYAIWG